MLKNKYFYNSAIKKVVAMFGTIFNDIYIAQRSSSGALTNYNRVPLAYAPREKYLARINAIEKENVNVALKLPRMSFEITSFVNDSASKINRLNYTIQESNTSAFKIWQASPWTIIFALNIMSRSQDEALQIVEQILPYFNPNYTVTVKGLEGPESITDIPITLTDLAFEDSYEGDFESSRRTIIYTLTFDVKIKFIAPLKDAKPITAIDLNYYNDLLDTASDITQYILQPEPEDSIYEEIFEPGIDVSALDSPYLP